MWIRRCSVCRKDLTKRIHGVDWAYCGTCVDVLHRTNVEVCVKCFPEHVLIHELQGQCHITTSFVEGHTQVSYHAIPPKWDQELWLGKRK